MDSRRIKVDVSNTEAILGFEAAAAYWGYSTYSYAVYPIFVYSGGSCATDGRVIDREITSNEYIISEEGYKVMKPEYAICDMIEYEADMFHTLESIDRYFHFADDTTPLENLAKKRGIYDKLMEYAEIAEKDFEEQ